MNPELRNLTTGELIRALEKGGFQWTHTKGSHRVYRHPDGRRAIVAYHKPSATFPPKTLTAIIAGAAWSDDDLRRLGLL